MVLHTGNIGLKQGLAVVVEAARITRDRRDLRWVLMGDGSQRADLQRQGSDLPNLEFLPLCATEDYPEFLAAADILLLCERPSVKDMCLPSKLTSYFTSGVPVASAVSAYGSTARELTLAGAPTPSAPGDAEALVKQIIALSADPQLGARHGADAAQYAHENLAFDIAAERLDAVLAAAVADHARSAPRKATRHGSGDRPPRSQGRIATMPEGSTTDAS